MAREMVRLYCFYEELWQRCNLFLMRFVGRNLPHRTVFISTVYSFNLLLSFNLVDWIEGHWIMHVVHLKKERTWPVCALWCIFSFVLMRNVQQGARTADTLIGFPPALPKKKLRSQGNQSFFFMWNWTEETSKVVSLSWIWIIRIATN